MTHNPQPSSGTLLRVAKGRHRCINARLLRIYFHVQFVNPPGDRYQPDRYIRWPA
jgi:hypothetical protein